MRSEYIHTAVGAIGVVVNAANEVLLVLSKDRGWEPPMGFLEAGESPLFALEREVREESGYAVRVLRLSGVYHCVRHGMPILSFCFLCEAGELIGTPDNETLGIQWVAIDKLEEVMTYPPHVLRVTDALKGGGVSFRDYQLQPFQVLRTCFLS